MRAKPDICKRIEINRFAETSLYVIKRQVPSGTRIPTYTLYELSNITASDYDLLVSREPEYNFALTSFILKTDEERAKLSNPPDINGKPIITETMREIKCTCKGEIYGATRINGDVIIVDYY